MLWLNRWSHISETETTTTMNRRFPSSSDWTLIHRNSSNSGPFLAWNRPTKEDESSSELFSLRTTVAWLAALTKSFSYQSWLDEEQMAWLLKLTTNDQTTRMDSDHAHRIRSWKQALLSLHPGINHLATPIYGMYAWGSQLNFVIRTSFCPYISICA